MRLTETATSKLQGALSMEIKRPGHAAVHYPLFSAMGKDLCSYNSIPHKSSCRDA
jgi:hypothetical protein